ncbi:hypothetical protein MMPV_006784 [Pyropia vietnamensis]
MGDGSVNIAADDGARAAAAAATALHGGRDGAGGATGAGMPPQRRQRPRRRLLLMATAASTPLMTAAATVAAAAAAAVTVVVAATAVTGAPWPPLPPSLQISLPPPALPPPPPPLISATAATSTSPTPFPPPCTIGPPYTGILLGGITADTPSTLADVLATLRSVCEVVLAEPGMGTPIPGGETTYLLTASQVEALWDHHRLRVRVIETDVGAVLAQGPTIEEVRPRRRQPPMQLPSGSPRQLGLAVSPKNSSTNGTDARVDDSYAPPPPETAAEATEFYTAYRSLTAIQDRMAGLAADYPALARTIRIGTSARGRPLTALIVGNTPPDAPVRIAVLGLQHAREWVAGLVPLYAAEMLVRGARDHLDLAAFLARVQLLFIPVVNPDGFVHTVTTDRLWRKNRSGDRHACPGVDLNRNWAKDWGGPHATSTDDPCSAVYTGPAAFSEPETAAVRDLLTASPGVVGFLDFHAYGQLVLGAWAYAEEEAPAHLPDERAYGAAVTAGVNAVHGSGYLYGSGGELIYLASGVSTDWATAANMSALTIELRPGGTGIASVTSSDPGSDGSGSVAGPGRASGGGFLLPASLLLPTCEEGMAGVITAARFLEHTARVDRGAGVQEGDEEDTFEPLRAVDWVPVRGAVVGEETTEEGKGEGDGEGRAGLGVSAIGGIVGAAVGVMVVVVVGAWLVLFRGR